MIRPCCRIALLGIIATLAGVSAGSAQNAVGFATDFLAQDQVVELTVPEALSGKFFVIVWNTPEGQHSRLTLSRQGTHVYDMRQLPHWQGARVSVIATTLPVSARLKTPSLSDEVDMLFEPQVVQPNTVNGRAGHSIMGWSEEAFGIVMWLLFAGLFTVIRRKRIVVSLVLGFALSWGFTELRLIFDDVLDAYTFEVYRPGMFPLADAGKFADEAARIIGNGSWGSAPIEDTLFAGFLRYRLAEKPFIPEGSSRGPDFWFTQNPNDGQVLLQFANYSLVKKNQP
jgi:hypothetical protein